MTFSKKKEKKKNNTEYVIQESGRCREPSPKRARSSAGDVQILRIFLSLEEALLAP